MDTLHQKLMMMENNYFNQFDSDAIVSDETYDLYKELHEEEPNQSCEHRVGAKVWTRKRTKLPYYMGSLDKMKNNETDKWIKWKKSCNHFIIEPKLDGITNTSRYYEYIYISIYLYIYRKLTI